MTETLIEKIKILNLEDGDIICLLHPGRLSRQAFEGLKAAVNDVFPQLKDRILILDEGMDITVIRSSALKAELAEADKC